MFDLREKLIKLNDDRGDPSPHYKCCTVKVVNKNVPCSNKIVKSLFIGFFVSLREFKIRINYLVSNFDSSVIRDPL